MKLTEEKYDKIISKVCWGGISGCCLLENECQQRDAVLKEIGLTPEEFTTLKKAFDDELKIKLLNGGGKYRMA